MLSLREWNQARSNRFHRHCTYGPAQVSIPNERRGAETAPTAGAVGYGIGLGWNYGGMGLLRCCLDCVRRDVRRQVGRKELRREELCSYRAPGS